MTSNGCLAIQESATIIIITPSDGIGHRRESRPDNFEIVKINIAYLRKHYIQILDRFYFILLPVQEAQMSPG